VASGAGMRRHAQSTAILDGGLSQTAALDLNEPGTSAFARLSTAMVQEREVGDLLEVLIGSARPPPRSSEHAAPRKRPAKQLG
jgi:hypothetical protein